VDPARRSWHHLVGFPYSEKIRVQIGLKITAARPLNYIIWDTPIFY
jgi:hypothetical protein